MEGPEGMNRFDGVIFDMDGTLVHSPLDFAAMRRELGIADARQGILEALDARPPADREDGHKRLLEMELAAAAAAEIDPHATGALDAVRSAGLKTALLTRNAAPVMEQILGQFPQLQFDLAWSRENGPIKPEPDGVLRACGVLGIAPRRTACVGDFYLDMVAARAAGAWGILLAPGASEAARRQAHQVIETLAELPAALGIATPMA